MSTFMLMLIAQDIETPHDSQQHMVKLKESSVYN